MWGFIEFCYSRPFGTQSAQTLCAPSIPAHYTLAYSLAMPRVKLRVKLRRESSLLYFFKKVHPSDSCQKNRIGQPGSLHARVLASNAKGKTSNRKYYGVASKTAEARNSHAEGRRAQTPSFFRYFSSALNPKYFHVRR